MKKTYQKPVMELTSFKVEDVITLSSDTTQTTLKTVKFNTLDY